MTSDTRKRMITGAAGLLASRGMAGTSFSALIEATGAPRGSIYHHFPGGKEELLAEAIRFVGRSVVRAMPGDGAGPGDVAARFVGLWRGLLVGSQFRNGCAVAAAVGAGADDAAVFEAASAVLRDWRDELADRFAAGGVDAEAAGRLALVLVAGVEGAVLIARADRSIESFDVVADELVAHVAAAAT
jgi:TetR/AcrR family transcriptional regulator, lmrAB and yxaGH operons repressor